MIVPSGTTGLYCRCSWSVEAYVACELAPPPASGKAPLRLNLGSEASVSRLGFLPVGLYPLSTVILCALFSMRIAQEVHNLSEVPLNYKMFR